MTDSSTASPPPLPSNALYEDVRRLKKFWLRVILLSVTGAILPNLLGMLLTAFGMIRNFSGLSGSDGTRSDSPRAVDSLRAVLIEFPLTAWLTVWGFIVSAIAFVVLAVAIIRFFSLPQIPPRQ